MENEKMFELMTKMYSEMKEGFSKVDTRLDGIDTRLDGMDTRIDKIENVVTNIEYTHGQKLETLFDGYIQNKQQLDRIEEKVSQHDEIILRRIQ